MLKVEEPPKRQAGKKVGSVQELVEKLRNDPFVPASSLPSASDVGTSVTLWQPAHGGHVGFPQGRWPGEVIAMPQIVGDWLLAASR